MKNQTQVSWIWKIEVQKLCKRAEELVFETKGSKIDLLTKQAFKKLILNKINQGNSDEENSNDSHKNEEDIWRWWKNSNK